MERGRSSIPTVTSSLVIGQRKEKRGMAGAYLSFFNQPCTIAHSLRYIYKQGGEYEGGFKGGLKDGLGEYTGGHGGVYQVAIISSLREGVCRKRRRKYLGIAQRGVGGIPSKLPERDTFLP